MLTFFNRRERKLNSQRRGLSLTWTLFPSVVLVMAFGFHGRPGSGDPARCGPPFA